MSPKAPAKRLTALPDLPSTVISKDRQSIDLSQDTWRFRVSADGGKLVLLAWDRGCPARS